MADSFSTGPDPGRASDSVDQENDDADVPTDGTTADATFVARASGVQRSGPSTLGAQRNVPTIRTLAKQAGKQRDVPRDDDDATQATTQDSRWRAGVNRQAQPQVQQHQVAASHAAAAKRTAAAMPTDVRNAKRAAHMREVRARQAAERAAAAAGAAAARVPDRRRLNVWLAEDDKERCNEDEWDAFEEYTRDKEDVADFDELDDDELERDGFLEMFLDWRESDEYERYAENENEPEFCGSRNSSPRSVSLLQPSIPEQSLHGPGHDPLLSVSRAFAFAVHTERGGLGKRRRGVPLGINRSTSTGRR